ncbi:MAG: efflux RND transporter periplasmic adaptor subunit [Bryobacteraceae bacterium]
MSALVGGAFPERKWFYMFKKVIIRLFGLAILVGLGYGGYRFFQQLPERQQQIATARVQRSDVVIRAFSRGELHAVRSVAMLAPNLNGTVQITRLAPVGSLAQEKDLVVEYDDSERQAALEEARLGVQQVDEQIKQVKVTQDIQASEDALTLLGARYAIRTAELNVQQNPILDPIDAKKNILNLEETRRALTQLEIDAKSRQDQFASQLAVYQEQRNRSLLTVTQELSRIAQTKSLAPMTGLVAIRQNRAGNFNFGQQMPDVREGDTLQPGMPVADLLDLSEVEVWAKVGELDRANLKEGQDAVLQLDAIPDKQFHGKIKNMSGTATSDVFSGDPSKKFDVVFSVDMRQLLSGLGMKPADIDRIMATAVENAKKNLGATPASSMFGAGPTDQGGMAGAMPGAEDNQEQGGGRGRGAPSGPRGGRGQGMSAADRQKMQDLIKQSQNSSPAERQKLIEQFTQSMAASPSPVGPSGRGAGGRGGEGRGGGGAGQAVGRAGDNTLQELVKRYTVTQYTEEERNNAKLPLPPEEDSQVQVLLRPGLLADVEIQVEKIPDALHVPAQAVFEKNGKPTVFVQQKNKRFEAREVQVVKQSESMMVLASGVKQGDIVALSDPTVQKSGKKETGEKKSQGSPMGGMGGGK